MLVITPRRAPRGCAEALSEQLLLTRFEFGEAQGTVGKLLTSAFQLSRQREPSEVSGPSTSTVISGGKLLRFGEITQSTDSRMYREYTWQRDTAGRQRVYRQY